MGGAVWAVSRGWIIIRGGATPGSACRPLSGGGGRRCPPRLCHRRSDPAPPRSAPHLRGAPAASPTRPPIGPLTSVRRRRLAACQRVRRGHPPPIGGRHRPSPRRC